MQLPMIHVISGPGSGHAVIIVPDSPPLYFIEVKSGVTPSFDVNDYQVKFLIKKNKKHLLFLINKKLAAEYFKDKLRLFISNQYADESLTKQICTITQNNKL